MKRTVLFEVDLYDPTPHGTKVHAEYDLVEINKKKKYKKYEPFVLANQATQAVYFPYPGVSRVKSDWLGVIPIRARAKNEYVEKDESITNSFQSDVVDEVARRLVHHTDEHFALHQDQFVELELQEGLLGKHVTISCISLFPVLVCIIFINTNAFVQYLHISYH